METLPSSVLRVYDRLDEIELWGNTAWNYLMAAATFLAIAVLLQISVTMVVRGLLPLAKRTPPRIDEIFLQAVQRIPGWVYAVMALYAATRPLRLPSTVEKVLLAVVFGTTVIVVTRLIQKVALRLILRLWVRDRSSEHVAATLGLIVNLILWSVGLLFVLSNIGIDITTLVASLGIGGIAVALASQNILSDMFSSFSIYFDRPFVTGDLIVTGQHMGVVRRIGLKTTRIQALEGEEIVIPNRELTGVRVQNYKRMRDRRVEIPFALAYGTPTETLRRVPEIMKSIVQEQKLARFVRACLKDVGPANIAFELVYYVDSPNYSEYAKVREAINFGILEAFEKEGIEFAMAKKPLPGAPPPPPPQSPPPAPKG